MRTVKAVALVALLAVSGIAAASDLYRFSRGVVAVGDSVAALVDRAGKPDRVVQLENRRGAASGERWEYYVGDQMVAFYIRGGRIESIDDATS